MGLKTCKICNEIHEKLGKHVWYKHKISGEEYYLKYIDKQTFCNICNNNTTFKDIEHGFHKFCFSKECRKYTRSNNIEYWLHKTNGDLELSKKMVKERQTITEEKMIKKYGEEKGKIKWDNFISSHKLTTNEYFVQKYGAEKAKEINNKKATNTLEFYNNKYGIELGEEKWKEYVDSIKVTKENFILRYGIELGEEKWKKLTQVKREQQLGKNNNMYGKPSPTGSGNGWTGWYKGWFFRSLLELSYMINVIEKNNLKWLSTENKKFQIKYKDYKGSDRTYYPDFLIDDKKIVEIKPKKLFESDNVVRKANAAIEFCKNNCYVYELIEPEKLSIEKIKEIYEKGDIIFIKRYEQKFMEMYYGK